jgi:ATP-dependent DNA helicase RecG
MQDSSPLQDLRLDLIAEVRNHARLTNPKHAWSNLEDMDLLKSTGLLQLEPGTGEWSITPAGTLIFGTETSISSLFPDLRTLIVYRDRADGKRLETETPLNLVETLHGLQNAVERSFPDQNSSESKDHASLRGKVFRTLFADFIKKRDYFHATSAKLTLNPEHLSLQFAQIPSPLNAQAGEKSLNTVLGDFFNALYPETASGIDGDASRKTMQVYFGATPVILHGSMFSFLALKPKIAPEHPSTPSKIPPAVSTPDDGSANATDKLAWKMQDALPQAKKVTPPGIHATMQGSQTKVFRESRSETSKIEWNAPKTVQVSRTAKILEYCKTPRYREEIQQHVGMNNRDHFRKEVLNPLIEKGLIRPTLPDKPNSPKQQYVTV